MIYTHITNTFLQVYLWFSFAHYCIKIEDVMHIYNKSTVRVYRVEVVITRQNKRQSTDITKALCTQRVGVRFSIWVSQRL